MVNYALLNSEDIVEAVLTFESEMSDLSPFIEAQNLVCDGRIVRSIKVSNSEKFWGPGMKYDGEKIWPVKPYPSWVWDDMFDQWSSPVPHPSVYDAENTALYNWNEENQSWELAE